MPNQPNYYVLYDQQNVALFAETVEPNLPENGTAIAFQSIEALSFDQSIPVWLWLTDEYLSTVLPYAAQQGWQVGFLPHPEMTRFYRGLSLPGKVVEAIADIQGCEQPTSIDLLYCNDLLVLDSVRVGNPHMMDSTAQADSGFWGRIKHIIATTLNASNFRLTPYHLETEKGFVVKTAAIGISFAYRAESTGFSRYMADEVQTNQAMLNTVILAPRSLSEIGRFLFSRLFFKRSAKGLEACMGHIRSRTISLSNEQGLNFTLDGIEHSADRLDMRVEANALQVLSQSLPEQSLTDDDKESIRVASLPKGEAVKELVQRPLPWIHHVDQEEVKNTFVNLKESAQISESYLVLMVLSTLLATVGLFANSAPVIIGAMILAPLMAPIVSLSMGVLRQNTELIGSALKTLSIGIFLALLFGFLFTLMVPLQAVTSEIAARLNPTILDLAVAVISGIAGAYANTRSEVAKSLAGVAIAVALVPPLAVSGIGIGWLDWHTFSAAFLLFLTNLAGIVLASTLTFLVMGFSPFHLAKKGMALALASVLVVSVPLSLSFAKLVDKQQLVSKLEDFSVANIELRDVQIKQQVPLYVSATLLSEKNIDNQQLDKVKQQIEAQLQQEIILEARVAILR